MKQDLFKNINESLKKTEEKNEISCNTMLHEKEKKYNLLPSLELELIEYSADPVLNNFLAQKSLKLRTMQANASIVLGETFEDVKKELGRKANTDGLYIQWLENNGYTRMTALRHRNRYSLFEICKNECGKLTIATLPTKLIQEIAKIKNTGERDSLLKKIDEGATREEIEDILGIDLLENKAEKKERDLITKIEIYDFLDEEKLKSIKDENELKFWKNKSKEFKDILKSGDNILLDLEVKFSNNKNKYKTVK